MKIHLVKKRSVIEYIDSNPNSEKPFLNWLKVLDSARWNKPSDILFSFRTADILGKGTNRVVFDLGGNNFRCICTYKFGKNYVHLFINWIGSHSEYDKIWKANLQFKVSNY